MTAYSPVVPVDAATVILARQPARGPWETFMVRRHVRSEFAADVFVFPGGKVDEADRGPDVAGFARNHAAPEWEDAERQGWLALKLAAIRELFEEAGVLLALRDDDLVRFEGPAADRFSAYRRSLQLGELSMLELARDEQLCLAADQLHPFSRWITPVNLPRRYDTRFLVARLPAGQEPLHDALETTESRWIAPAEALERHGAGEFPLVFATEKHLERMARYESIDDLIASTRAADLEPVMPRIVRRGEQTVFLLPGEAGY